MRNKKISISRISAIHYFKLVFRSILFITAIINFIFIKLHHLEKWAPLIMGIIWIDFTLEMILRFFPSKFESMGCQKQFKRNYESTGCYSVSEEHQWWRTLAVIAFWVILNGIIAVLYYTGIIEKEILILVALFYSVCDMICILFFCPFQSWMLKNKCCAACRIYNWDYAMMFTPFLFIRSFFTYSLLLMSIILLVRWEITYRLYPERFFASTNERLSCKNCPEKLCSHKSQLKHLWKRERERLKRLKAKVINKVQDVSED